MKIVLCNGGLVNQLYQHIFARYLAILHNEEVILDDSIFFLKEHQHNGFEIDKVFPHTKLKLLSSLFPKDEWEEIINRIKNGEKLVPILNEKNFSLTILVESKFFNHEQLVGETKNTPIADAVGEYIFQSNGVPKEMANCPNIFYAGFWIDFRYYNKIRPNMLEELRFPPIPNETNKEYLKQIESCFSVGVHIRRGDFLNKNFQWGLPAEYYYQKVNQVKRLFELKEKIPTYFVFSDDINWCKENKIQLGFINEDNVVFVEGNSGNGLNYIDLQLMSNLNWLIASRSAFCLTSRLFSITMSKYIEAPSRAQKFDVE